MVKNEGVQLHQRQTSDISLTDAAKSHIRTQLNGKENMKGVRLSVQKTGCSGLSYVFDFVETVNEQDKVFEVEPNLRVYVEYKSFPFLKGTAIDYVKEGINFKFMFSNPNQTGQCGCGESFTVDEAFLSSMGKSEQS